jgi:uncharacterized membrane protein YcaP (DUF421 family)
MHGLELCFVSFVYNIMFWDSWESLGEIIIVGTLAYIALIVMLQISGKRTLSKFNAFDFIITVAFGSILATTLTSSTVSLSEGITALGILIVLQFVITWMCVRSDRFQSLVKSEPTLLYHEGKYLHDAMKKERVTKDEIQAAMREHSSNENEESASAVLETDGTISISKKIPNLTSYNE